MVNEVTQGGAALVLAIVLTLPGCATRIAADPNERPTLVDPARTDMTAYRKDYGECVVLANQVDAGQVAGGGAAAGAVAGALVGTLIGAVIGYAVNDTATGMRVGASLGGIEGALGGSSGAYGAARADQEGALRNCLRGRGYNLIR